ncbi:DUF4381 domain-containing protein [Legionella spiritensis]|uniref:DUF4381 domain-containing protein n=1 Tax=Legionella spiritensis TaxID=452 RepID=A0A0W0ZAX7_LEGSP|nr:DUF4381 domain-containing protein [Legionella spiritensis]KTD66264.1 hypothetical protein Lspi_0027 [Legionella spiritensis]SNV48390.1 Uncharacterised protein [Legionella spiritensis]VEG91474.1 Uncharacterised protein [Legionella spiritensis]
MADSQPLAQLRDIHLPAPIGWWPLAPGWYFLALGVLVLLLVAVFFIHRRYSYGRARRQALQLLARYRQEYMNEGNSQVTSAKVSELLRRVALVYFSRERVAGLQGDAWIEFLNSTGKDINFSAVRECLIELPYQAPKSINLKPLFTRAEIWIKQRGVPCSN